MKTCAASTVVLLKPLVVQIHNRLQVGGASYEPSRKGVAAGRRDAADLGGAPRR